VCIGLEHRHDVGVGQAADGARLVQPFVHRHGVGIRAQQLLGHLAVQPRVMRQPDGGLRALAQAAQQAKTPQRQRGPGIAAAATRLRGGRITGLCRRHHGCHLLPWAISPATSAGPRLVSVNYAGRRCAANTEKAWCCAIERCALKLVSHLVSHFILRRRSPMSSWPVQDAKARFSEFLDACLAEGPQLVTRRGAETAVLVPVAEWRRLQATARPSLKQLLLQADAAQADGLVLPVRGSAKRRPPIPAR
jgi:prevent-host-death family protein